MKTFRVLGLLAAVCLLQASSCINKPVIRTIDANYADVHKIYVQLLQERGKFNQAFFVQVLGQESGDKLWKELAIVEYTPDTVRQFTRQADELKDLIKVAGKE